MTISARNSTSALIDAVDSQAEAKVAPCRPGAAGLGAWTLNGIVTHRRFRPVVHAFRYKVALLVVDVDSLDELDQSLFGFGYNRWSLLQIKDRDYLSRETEGTLRERLTKELVARGGPAQFRRCLLVTSPRVLGYVFNPVSFFICLGEREEILATVAHVNNTFGDAHLYVLHSPCKESGSFDVSYRVPKNFHVSPFFKIEGEYEFQLKRREKRLHIHMNYNRGDDRIFEADLEGELGAANRYTPLSHALRAPARGILTMPRILAQAARLHYQKRLPVYERPAPSHPDTVTVRGPSAYQRLAMSAVCSLLGRIRHGCLHLRMPDGKELRFTGSEHTEPVVELSVRDYDFFARVFRDSDVGAAESFMRGEWTTDSLVRVLELGARNWEIMPRRNLGFTSLRDLLFHRLRKNTRAGSKKNIGEHYDLGDELFTLFLDESMTYSGAYFTTGDMTLYQAQREKLSRLARLAGINSGDHVLEVGCGWGSFAKYAAQELGCRVTCVTVSRRQFAYVESMILKHQLSDRVEVRLQDYRDLSGSFDKIVSIEMIEAVGEEYLPTFFATMNRLLKPDGCLALQAITIPEQRRELYSKGCDFIQKYIFPGCYVPSLEQLLSIAGRATELSLKYGENIALHYAETLRRWREKFTERVKEVRGLGYDEQFVRKWEFYFAYCEVGFSTHALGLHQLVFHRSQVGRTT